MNQRYDWLQEIHRYAEGQLDAAEMAALSAALRQDSTLRRDFLELLNLDSAIDEMVTVDDSGEALLAADITGLQAAADSIASDSVATAPADGPLSLPPPGKSSVLGFLGDVGRQGWDFLSDHTLLFSLLAVMLIAGAVAFWQAAGRRQMVEGGSEIVNRKSEIPNSPSGTDGHRAGVGLVAGEDPGEGTRSPRPPGEGQGEGILKGVQPPLAALSNVSAARWAGSPPMATGSDQLPAIYHLLEGGAEITLANGTVITLEAPCRLELLGSQQALLHEGRVVAFVPDHSVKFLIETPTSAVLDLGTEFGVGIRPDGQTLVQVYQGKVVATAKSPLARSVAGRQVTAGEAVSVGKTIQDIRFVANRFIRWLPEPERHDDRLSPRNKPQVETLLVPRARKPVRVDGDLTDWDMSRAFKGRCNAPYSDDYHVRGAMMYDEKNLYLAAVVADPAPMRNVVDPALNAEDGWRGGSVQIRLVANRASGWPSNLMGEHGYSSFGGKDFLRELRPEDLDERVLHLTMWYFEPRGQACLNVERRMDFRGYAVNPPGYQGAFRKLDDGRGYVMEYAVPWEALSIVDRPRAGDVLPATWIVNWSDEGGRSWRGKLVEVQNRSETGWAELFRAVSWGKVQFLP